MAAISTRTTKTTEPHRMDVALDATLSVAMNDLTSSGMTLISKPILPAVRDRLEDRRVQLVEALQPARREPVVTTVLHMLAAFGSSRGGADDMKALAGLWAEDLRSQPLWAVERTCGAYRRGEVPGANRAFAPSLAEVMSYCRDIVLRYERELHKVTAVLSAKVSEPPPRDPEAIDRILAKFNGKSFADAESEALATNIRNHSSDDRRVA